MLTDAQTAEYQQLTSGVGSLPLSQQGAIRVVGDDRQSFINNFCTNDIRRLEAGQGCEAFFTNVQGKIVAFAAVFCDAEQIVLQTVVESVAPLMAHLDRYLLSEDVSLTDICQSDNLHLLAGPQSGAWLAEQAAANGEAALYSSQQVVIGGCHATVRRVGWTADAWLIQSAAEDAATIESEMSRLGVEACSAEAWQSVRIENGWPEFGTDICDANLPQEVGRDKTAISFTKGCYLGQETVARIDALGHVNRTLRGLKFSGTEIPSPGAKLGAERELATVTSIAWSPALKCPLALGYVRRGSDSAGTAIETDQFGVVEVVSLPIS